MPLSLGRVDRAPHEDQVANLLLDVRPRVLQHPRPRPRHAASGMPRHPPRVPGLFDAPGFHGSLMTHAHAPVNAASNERD